MPAKLAFENAKLENSAVAKRLEKVSIHPNPKEKQCHRIFKLSYNCAHFTCKQGDAQNLSSSASGIHEPRTSTYKLDLEKTKEPEIKLPTFAGS